MNRKFLDGLFSGVDVEETTKKDIIDKIMTENGKQIETHNTKIATMQNDLKVKENLIDELNEKIKENSQVDIEAIKQEQFELGKAEGQKEFETFKKTNALEKALGNFKAKDIKILQKLIDGEKLEYEEKNGELNIKGLTEQIDGLKQTHDYLFEKEEPKQTRMNTGTDTNGTQNQTKTTDSVKLNSMFKQF